MPRVIVLTLLLCLAACAASPRGPVQLPNPHISPAAMQMDVSVAQRLSFDRGEQGAVTPLIDAQLEVDASAIRFAGFATGQRVLTFIWDGRSIVEQRSAQLPEHVRAEHILRDFQFVCSPAAALRAALPGTWRVEESAGVRLISARDQESAVIEIRYAGDSCTSGSVQMRNRVERYVLTVESADVNTEPAR